VTNETGAAAQYWSWRNLHYSLAAWGLFEMLLIYVSFPETSHPGTMGVEKVARKRRFHIVWVNPLSSLWLLRSPNLFAIVSVFFWWYNATDKLVVCVVDAGVESCARQ